MMPNPLPSGCALNTVPFPARPPSQETPNKVSSGPGTSGASKTDAGLKVCNAEKICAEAVVAAQSAATRQICQHPSEMISYENHFCYLARGGEGLHAVPPNVKKTGAVKRAPNTVFSSVLQLHILHGSAAANELIS